MYGGEDMRLMIDLEDSYYENLMLNKAMDLTSIDDILDSIRRGIPMVKDAQPNDLAASLIRQLKNTTDEDVVWLFSFILSYMFNMSADQSELKERVDELMTIEEVKK